MAVQPLSRSCEGLVANKCAVFKAPDAVMQHDPEKHLQQIIIREGIGRFRGEVFGLGNSFGVQSR